MMVCGSQVGECSDLVLSRNEVAEGINPHLLSILRIDETHSSSWVAPETQVSPYRFDLMAKYLYVRLGMLHTASTWPDEVYRKHLEVWSGFVEGDGSGKNSYDKFIKSFQAVIKSIKSTGFESGEGLIPVGSDSIFIDGAHRIAAALVFHRKIQIVQFPYDANRYDFDYFARRGLPSQITDAMALEYCRLKSGARIAVLFPVAGGKDRKVEELLEKCGVIFYKKSVIFNRVGRGNLVRLLYRGEQWLGNGKEETPGLRHHIERRFIPGKAVKFIFLDCSDLSMLLQVKASIRSLFNMGNDPIHINDSHEETVELGQQILNSNGIHFLNHARVLQTDRFDELFAGFSLWVQREGIDPERLCIDGSGVLAAYGLRDVNDLDFLCCSGEDIEAPISSVSSHNEEAIFYKEHLDDVIIDPRYHFWWRGLKFVSLDTISRMKERRNEAKDRRDLVRIGTIVGNKKGSALILKIMSHIPETTYSLRYRLISKAKALVPSSLRPLAKAIYDLPLTMHQWLGPHERCLTYRGFELHYSRGTSLVRGIQRGEIYEQKLTSFIVEELKGHQSPLFLDVGANIGLISLNVLHEISTVTIWAFEPGPHQAQLFRRTIEANDLADRVQLVEKALSFENGELEFRVHCSQHASGDGFFDTHRAGKTSRIKVKTQILDELWKAQGCPKVDLVKVDTEGAELWVLQGAVELLRKARPVLVLEIDMRNIQPFPYGWDDLHVFLDEQRYILSELGGKCVERGALGEALQRCSDFVARPCK